MSCFSPYSFESAVREDTLEAYRQFLDENPNDINVSIAHRRMAEIEFNEAVKAGTIWGFKKFLEDYPDAIQVEAAKKYLEDLRFARAQKENTKQAYLTFLSFHADGDLSRKARLAIMEIEYAAVPKGDARALKKFVSFYPDSPFRADAEARLDDLEFEAAKAEGEAGLADYLMRHKSGPRAAEAKVLHARATLSRAIAHCRVKRAARLVSEFGRDPKLSAVAVEFSPAVAAARESCAARRELLALDRGGLSKLAKSKGPVAAAAAASLKLASTRPAAFGDLKASTLSALAHREAGTLKSLGAAAASLDPLERHRAAVLLRFLPKGGSLDAALALMGDQYVPVRHAAAETVVAIARELGPAQLERAFGARIARFEEQARDAPLYFKAGVLSEARGLKSEALAFYRKAALSDRYDAYVLFRLALAESAAGERMKAVAAYAQFARLAAAALKEREGLWDDKAAQKAADAARATSFQYCGMLSLLRSAEAVVGPDAAAADLGSEERRVSDSVKGQIAKGAEFMEKAATALGVSHEAVCGGDGGAAAVAAARARRYAMVRVLMDAAPPWLDALLGQLKDFEPDEKIRKLAEKSSSASVKPDDKGERK